MFACKSALLNLHTLQTRIAHTRCTIITDNTITFAADWMFAERSLADWAIGYFVFVLQLRAIVSALVCVMRRHSMFRDFSRQEFLNTSKWQASCCYLPNSF